MGEHGEQASGRSVIELSGLGKEYPGKPPHRALSDLDLRVEQGEIFGFLGPNGAGKSTTIRILLGLLRPTEGTSVVLGLDTWRNSPEVRREVGYLPGDVRFPERQTGTQVLRLFARLRHRPCNYEELAERLDLDIARPIRAYSKGMKQKLGLIQALMHKPRLIILDEPTSGLDPITQRLVKDLLLECQANGATVFFSSHVLPEVEGLCNRVALLNQGRLLRCSRLEDMEELQRRRFVLPLLQGESHGDVLQRTGPTVLDCEIQDGVLVGHTQAVSDLVLALASRPIPTGELPLEGLRVEGLKLEDLFYELYEAQVDAGTAPAQDDSVSDDSASKGQGTEVAPL